MAKFLSKKALSAGLMSLHIGQSRNRRKTSWRLGVWEDYFTTDSTFHGIRHLFKQQSKRRRLIWLSIIMACTVAFAFNGYNRLVFYLADPITVNLDIEDLQHLSFPAVTICNFNRRRLSKVYEQGLYSYYAEVARLRTNPKTLSNDTVTFFENNDALYYSQDLYHDKRLLILRCIFAGSYCSADNFTVTETDMGTCHSFNRLNTTGPLIITESGASNGLQLTLNVEQYEYTGETGMLAAGIKVHIHDPNDFPGVADLGFNIGPGMDATVGLRKKYIKNIPNSHNGPSCTSEGRLRYFEGLHYTALACNHERLSEYVRRECKCQRSAVPPPRNETFMRNCNSIDYATCYQQAKPKVAKQKGQLCRENCETKAYNYAVSYASLSDEGTERIMAITEKKLKLVEENSKRAYEARARLLRTEWMHHSGIMGLMNIFNYARPKPLQQSITDFILEDWPQCHLTSLNRAAEMENATQKAIAILKQLTEKFISERNFIYFTKSLAQLHWIDMKIGFYYGDEVKNLFDKIRTGEYDKENLDAARWTTFSIHAAGRELIAFMKKNAHGLETRLKKMYEIVTFVSEDLLRSKRMKQVLLELSEFTKSMIECNERLIHSLELMVNNTNSAMKKAMEEKFPFDNDLLTYPRNVTKYLVQCRHLLQNNSEFEFDSIKQLLTNQINILEEIQREIFENFHSNFTLQPNFEMELAAAEQATLQLIQLIQSYNSANITKLQFAMLFTNRAFQEKLRLTMEFMARTFQLCRRVRDQGIESVQQVSRIGNQLPTKFAVFIDLFDLYYNKSESEKQEHLINESQCLMEINDLFTLKLDKLSKDYNKLSDLTVTAKNYMLNFINENTIDKKFIKDNFLRLSIYFKELREERVRQMRTYDFYALLSDIGGGLGLFMGASFITMFELCDTFIQWTTKVKHRKATRAGINGPTFVPAASPVHDITIRRCPSIRIEDVIVEQV